MMRNRRTRSHGLFATATGLLLLTVAAAAPVAAQLTPGSNVRLTFQLIQANGFRDADPAIADVVGQLEQLFRFRGYRLLTEATVLLAIPDEMTQTARQTIAASAEDRFEMMVALEDADGPIRLYLDLRDELTGRDILEVGVNVRDGQTVVLGSSKYDPEKPTLIVAVRINQAG